MMLTLEKDRRVQPLIQGRSSTVTPKCHPTVVAGVRVERLRAAPGFCAAVSGRQRGEDSGVHRWRRAAALGKERAGALLHRARGALMSVPVKRGPTWTAGTPTKLIRRRVLSWEGGNDSRMLRCLARRQAVLDDQAGGFRRPAGRPHRCGPALVGGAEAPRADEIAAAISILLHDLGRQSSQPSSKSVLPG